MNILGTTHSLLYLFTIQGKERKSGVLNETSQDCVGCLPEDAQVRMIEDLHWGFVVMY